MAMINEKGVEAFKYFDGAFAMVWWHEAEPDVIYMARNEERPLHFIVTNKGRTILGASEAGMLGWLAERNRFTLGTDKHDSNIWSLAPNKLYQFSLKEIGRYKAIDLPKFDGSLLPAPPATYNYHGRSGYDEADWGRSGMGSRGWTMGGTSSYIDPRQEEVLEAVKSALNKARTSRLAPNKDVVVRAEDLDDNLEAAIKKSIEEFEKRDGTPPLPMEQELALNTVFLPSSPHSTCSQEEVEAARRLSMFGRVAIFRGVFWDKEVARGYGSIAVASDVTKTIHYRDAEIRGITETEFRNKFEGRNATYPMVAVIGRNPKALENLDEGYDPTFVVTQVGFADEDKIRKTLLVDVKKTNTLH